MAVLPSRSEIGDRSLKSVFACALWVKVFYDVTFTGCDTLLEQRFENVVIFRYLV